MIMAAAAALSGLTTGWAETGQEALNIAGVTGLLALTLVGLPAFGYLHFAQGRSNSALSFLVGTMAIFLAASIAFVVTTDAITSHDSSRSILQSHINDERNLGCQRITLLTDSPIQRECVAQHGPGQPPPEEDGITSIGKWHRNKTINHTVTNYWTHFPEGREECLLAYHITGTTQVKRLSAEVQKIAKL